MTSVANRPSSLGPRQAEICNYSKIRFLFYKREFHHQKGISPGCLRIRHASLCTGKILYSPVTSLATLKRTSSQAHDCFQLASDPFSQPFAEPSAARAGRGAGRPGKDRGCHIQPLLLSQEPGRVGTHFQKDHSPSSPSIFKHNAAPMEKTGFPWERKVLTFLN